MDDTTQEDTIHTDTDIQIDTDTDTDTSEIQIEETDEDGGEQKKEDKIQSLREKIRVLEEEKKSYLDGWQRAQADAINQKKDFETQKKELIEFGNRKLLMEFIPVMDSFLMAMKNKEAWESIDKNWRNGVEYIRSQFETALKNEGLEIFGTVGEQADPHKYNSLEVVVTRDVAEDGKVAEILQAGYTLRGKVIREAKCKTFLFEENK